MKLIPVTLRKAGRWAALCVLVCVAAACSLDYGVAEEKETDLDQPEIELQQLEHTVVRSGRKQIRLRGEDSKTYREENRQELSNVIFYEYGPEGDIVTEGRAADAEIFLDSEDVHFSGDVQLYSHQEEAGIEADYLEWDGEERQLQGEDGEEVVITRDDGSVITGTGFLANMRERTLKFAGEVDGTFVEPADEEEADDAEEE